MPAVYAIDSIGILTGAVFQRATIGLYVKTAPLTLQVIYAADLLAEGINSDNIAALKSTIGVPTAGTFLPIRTYYLAADSNSVLALFEKPNVGWLGEDVLSGPGIPIAWP